MITILKRRSTAARTRTWAVAGMAAVALGRGRLRRRVRGGGGGGGAASPRPATARPLRPPAAPTRLLSLSRARASAGSSLTAKAGRFTCSRPTRGTTSACDGACASAWPPLTTAGQPIPAPPAWQPRSSASTERSDGDDRGDLQRAPAVHVLRRHRSRSGERTGEATDRRRRGTCSRPPGTGSRRAARPRRPRATDPRRSCARRSRRPRRRRSAATTCACAGSGRRRSTGPATTVLAPSSWSGKPNSSNAPGTVHPGRIVGPKAAGEDTAPKPARSSSSGGVGVERLAARRSAARGRPRSARASGQPSMSCALSWSPQATLSARSAAKRARRPSAPRKWPSSVTPIRCSVR